MDAQRTDKEMRGLTVADQARRSNVYRSRARLSYLAAGSKSKSLSSASALIKRKGPLRRTYAHHCGTEHGVPSPTCVVRWPVGWIESAQGGLTSRFSPFVRVSSLVGWLRWLPSVRRMGNSGQGLVQIQVQRLAARFVFTVQGRRRS